MSYVTIKEKYRMKHVQVPKVFFTSDKYSNLSNDAKIAYALLMDRHNLSEANDWIEEGTGRIYFVFKQEQIMKLLNIGSKTTYQKVKKELVQADLLEFKRMGLKQPNRMYIKWPEVTDEDVYKIKNMESEEASNPWGRSEVQKMDFKKYENCTSRSTENGLQEVQKLYSINTEYNNTNLNNTELNNHHMISGFSQNQSNLIWEFVNNQKLDDDDQSKLISKLKGKNFKHAAYIQKTYETIKSLPDPAKPKRTELLPEWFEQPEQPKTPGADKEDVQAKRAALKAKLDKLKGAK